MTAENYSTCAQTETGLEIVRHYPFTGQGFDAAASLAVLRGYDVWQSFDGVPRYLLWPARPARRG